MTRFEGQVALVTGATSGIGRACTQALLRDGAHVVAAGRRKQRLDALAAEWADAVRTVTGDVRDPAFATACVTAALEAFGGLDLLVNAAGVIGNGSADGTTPEEWDRVMDSNLRSVFLMTRAAGPELRRRHGAIVTISSVASNRPYAGLAGYCVSKAAVDMFTRCAALDFASDGVRVNAVNPGVVVTELHTVAGAVADYPAFLERSKVTHPLGRVGQAEEIAALVCFLLSPEAAWITGATVPIDGGRALMSAR